MGPLKLHEWDPDIRDVIAKSLKIFETQQFSILVQKLADRHWSAHCLEMDIVGEGGSEKEAVTNTVISMALVIEDYINGEVQGSYFSPAPKEYWDLLVNAIAFPIDIELPKSLEQRGRRALRGRETRQVFRGMKSVAAAYC